MPDHTAVDQVQDSVFRQSALFCETAKHIGMLNQGSGMFKPGIRQEIAQAAQQIKEPQSPHGFSGRIQNVEIFPVRERERGELPAERHEQFFVSDCDRFSIQVPSGFQQQSRRDGSHLFHRFRPVNLLNSIFLSSGECQRLCCPFFRDRPPPAVEAVREGFRRMDPDFQFHGFRRFCQPLQQQSGEVRHSDDQDPLESLEFRDRGSELSLQLLGIHQIGLCEDFPDPLLKSEDLVPAFGVDKGRQTADISHGSPAGGEFADQLHKLSGQIGEHRLRLLLEAAGEKIRELLRPAVFQHFFPDMRHLHFRCDGEMPRAFEDEPFRRIEFRRQETGGKRFQQRSHLFIENPAGVPAGDQHHDSGKIDEILRSAAPTVFQQQRRHLFGESPVPSEKPNLLHILSSVRFFRGTRCADLQRHTEYPRSAFLRV